MGFLCRQQRQSKSADLHSSILIFPHLLFTLMVLALPFPMFIPSVSQIYTFLNQ